MDYWFVMPVKVLFIALLTLMFVFFAWRSIELKAVHTSAINAAYAASLNMTNAQVSAQVAATNTLSGSVVNSVINEGSLVTVTVTYVPPITWVSFFNFTGAISPDSPITLTGSAPINSSSN